MITAPPNCLIRKCKHLQGLKIIDDDPNNDLQVPVNYCAAFPNGIPDEIAYGNNRHFRPLPKQDNNIVYEK